MHKKEKFIIDCRLEEINFLNDRYFLMKLRMPIIIENFTPGQFVQVRVDGSQNTFLRRPISICQIFGDELWLLIQKAGDGSNKLSTALPGEYINVILPLGNGFSIPETEKRFLLIGGGVGIAPLLMLGNILNSKGFSVDFLLGGRTKTDLVLSDEFAKYGNVHYTTEDGSYGEKGFVTNHSILNSQWDMIYTCGPKPMMQAVARYAENKSIECEVSLENLMACGIGACLCCVEDTVDGHVCTCTEGPVFNIKKLKW
jgi:dihydroorotate dehydrogenase electron transfer subunit